MYSYSSVSVGKYEYWISSKFDHFLKIFRPHYNLNLQSIAVNGQLLSIDPAAFVTSSNRGTIVDSGTTLAYLVQEAYDPFVSAVSNFLLMCLQVIGQMELDQHFPYEQNVLGDNNQCCLMNLEKGTYFGIFLNN